MDQKSYSQAIFPTKIFGTTSVEQECAASRHYRDAFDNSINTKFGLDHLRGNALSHSEYEVAMVLSLISV